MASVEQIALQTYPVWDKQGDEPAEIFGLFERYFLPQVRGNLTAAYRAFITDTGGDSQSVTDVSGQWREYCKVYQWRERHTAFWRWKNHTDQQWREEQIRQYQSESLDTARLLRFKAIEILENFDIANASPKDAAALLRLSDELVSTALDWRDIDRAISAVHRWGLEVIDPKVDHLNGNVADSG